MKPTSLVAKLRPRFGDASSAEVLRVVLAELFRGRTAVVSSFDAESATLLHMVAAVDRATPVLFAKGLYLRPSAVP